VTDGRGLPRRRSGKKCNSKPLTPYDIAVRRPNKGLVTQHLRPVIDDDWLRPIKTSDYRQTPATSWPKYACYFDRRPVGDRLHDVADHPSVIGDRSYGYRQPTCRHLVANHQQLVSYTGFLLLRTSGPYDVQVQGDVCTVVLL